ncbi:MAG TPA: hypothetical protein DD412_00230 [Holosporales bacterium]|nr:hypothetical protein [Holosporales bacterium]
MNKKIPLTLIACFLYGHLKTQAIESQTVLLHPVIINEIAAQSADCVEKKLSSGIFKKIASFMYHLVILMLIGGSFVALMEIGPKIDDMARYDRGHH